MKNAHLVFCDIFSHPLDGYTLVHLFPLCIVFFFANDISSKKGWYLSLRNFCQPFHIGDIGHLFQVTAYWFSIFFGSHHCISIIGIFQISHWISIFRPTEMGGQVTQHVKFFLLNHYLKKNKTMKITWREPWSSWQLLGLLSFQKFLCALKPGNHHEWFDGESLIWLKSKCEKNATYHLCCVLSGVQ